MTKRHPLFLPKSAWRDTISLINPRATAFYPDSFYWRQEILYNNPQQFQAGDSWMSFGPVGPMFT